MDYRAERGETEGRRFVTVEADMLDRTSVTIPAENWDAFKAWLNRPAEIIPVLAKLARPTPSWEK